MDFVAIAENAASWKDAVWALLDAMGSKNGEPVGEYFFICAKKLRRAYDATGRDNQGRLLSAAASNQGRRLPAPAELDQEE